MDKVYFYFLFFCCLISDTKKRCINGKVDEVLDFYKKRANSLEAIFKLGD